MFFFCSRINKFTRKRRSQQKTVKKSITNHHWVRMLMNIIQVKIRTGMHSKWLHLIEVTNFQWKTDLAMSISNQQMHSITSTENMTKAHFRVLHCYSSVRCVNKVSIASSDIFFPFQPIQTFYEFRHIVANLKHKFRQTMTTQHSNRHKKISQSIENFRSFNCSNAWRFNADENISPFPNHFHAITFMECGSPSYNAVSCSCHIQRAYVLFTEWLLKKKWIFVRVRCRFSLISRCVASHRFRFSHFHCIVFGHASYFCAWT